MSLETYLSLAQGEPKELIAKANEIREQKYGSRITYSRNIFIPVTRQCRNHCGYCGFVNPSVKTWITPTQYLKYLVKAKENSCIEVLLTLGEKPEERYTSAQKFLATYNYSSTTEYVRNFALQALEYDMLPHANLGVLSKEELTSLKDVTASMGLMLESTYMKLLDKGQAHEKSPTKNPKLRLQTITEAGKLKIPFTTGILVGIGETIEDRIESLITIETINQQYNHIQEVIIQNFEPQPNTPMANHPPPTPEEFLQTVALARVILSPKISVQIPPNLNPNRIIDNIRAGANDLGGISPVTPDFINPQHPWPKEQKLRRLLEHHNMNLSLRLPVYKNHIKYLNKHLQELINQHYSAIYHDKH